MKKSQRGYLVAVAAAAVGAAAGVAGRGFPAPEVLAVFGLLALGAELLSVRLPNGATASPLMIPVMGAVVAAGGGGGLLAGGLVAGLGGLYLPDLRHRRVDRLTFNCAQLLLAGLAAAAVLRLLTPLLPASPWWLLGGLPAGLAFLAVNVGLLVPMLALDGDRPVRELLGELHPLHFQYVPFAVVGTGLGLLYTAVGPVALALGVAPILVGRQIFGSFLAVREAHEATLRMLVRALERKDPYTAGHVERVARYARYIGEELGLSEARLERLRYAALMHDVGKLAVATDLLRKPDRLTLDEYERVRIHEVWSVELLRQIDFLRPIATAASPRYARYDGGAGEAGRGRSGGRGPIEPYIIVVADAYDAMTSTRPYRRALSQAVAFEELRRFAGTQFHPACVDALIRALERREERHGAGYEEEIVLYDAPPPVRGPGSAGTGDLAPVGPARVR